jgi:YegS/Rv2252/BmrU family lipid kinase
MPNTVVIVNPNSAGGQTRRRWPRLEATLREAIGAFQPLFTERAGHATALARQALRDGAELVVSRGGDGTLNEVVNGFFDAARPAAPINHTAALALLPAGTGGDFPKTLGTPRDFDHAARALAAARPRPIDVGRLEYLDHEGQPALRHFINIASFGIGGLVDRYVNRSSKALGGKASFFLASLRATLAYKNAPVRITLDEGASSERTVYSVAVANGRYFGGGMKIAPDAALDDGAFDVITIGDVAKHTMLLHGTRVYSGTHTSLPFVTVERARRVRAESSRGEVVLLDVDGEQPGRLPATFEILPGAVRMMSV